MSNTYIPRWVKGYKILPQGHHGTEHLIIEFWADANHKFVKPISELAHDLAIDDVCQQMRDKPLHSRMDVIGQNGNTGEHYDQINPAHYKQGDVECIDAIKAALTPDEFRGYCKGNIIKYTWRERYKQGKTAMEKAKWYLERLIKVME